MKNSEEKGKTWKGKRRNRKWGERGKRGKGYQQGMKNRE
jgi:hypothetical protein